MQSKPVDARFARPEKLCFVIGAQKGGTTWVNNHFRSHPEICVPGLKEVNYWNVVRPPFMQTPRLALSRRVPLLALLRRLLSTPSMRRKDRSKALSAAMSHGSGDGSHAGYADVLFDLYEGEPVVAEVNPQYALLGAETFAEMAALSPDVRFVFLMRDPLGRIHSRLNQKIGKASRGATPTPAVIRAAYETLLAKGEDSDLIRRSAYDATLRELERAVPAERIALFFYENFFRPEEQQRLSAFLGVTHVEGALEKRVLKSKASVRDFPADLDARVLGLLRPTYAYFADRFGDALPAAWKRSMARTDPPATIAYVPQAAAPLREAAL